MLLRTLCFDPTVFKKNLTRFWPLWGVALLGFLLAGPIRLLTQSLGQEDLIYVASNANELVAYLGVYGVWIAAIFGAITAAVVFSYQFNSRSSISIHAMPFKRSCLFFTNYVSGLVMLMIPLVGGVLGMGLVEAVLGCFDLAGLLMWLTAQTLAYLYFYSFAVLCASLVANAVGMVICYLGFSALPMVIWSVVEQICFRFLFGYTTDNNLSLAAQWLTPFYNFSESLDVHTVAETVNAGVRTVTHYYIQGWTCLIVYAVAGIILTIPAGLLYHARKIETAGDLVAFSWLRPVFKYLVAICCGGVGAEFLYILLIPGGSNTSTPVDLPVYLLLGALGCFVGYFAALMLLDKTPWVFRGKRRWLGWAASVLAVMAVVLVIRADLFGYEDDLPRRENISSVTVEGNWNSYYAHSNEVLEEDDLIDQALAIHSVIVEEREELQQQFIRYNEERDQVYDTVTIPKDYNLWHDTHDVHSLTLTYQLRDGTTFTRQYRLYVDEEELARQGSPMNLLNTLINDPDYISKVYSWTEEIDSDRDEVEIWIPVLYYDEENSTYCDLEAPLTGENALALLDAIKADLAEQTLSAGTLLSGHYFGVYDRSWLNVQVSSPVLEQNYAEAKLAYAYPTAEVYTRSSMENYETRYHYALLTEDSSHTIQLLTELGVLDESHLLYGAGWHTGMEEVEYYYPGHYYDEETGTYVSDHSW